VCVPAVIGALAYSKPKKACGHGLKDGPETLEKKSHEFLDSKREDRFPNPLFELVPKKMSSFVFRTCFGMLISARARGQRKSSRRSARR